MEERLAGSAALLAANGELLSGMGAEGAEAGREPEDGESGPRGSKKRGSGSGTERGGVQAVRGTRQMAARGGNAGGELHPVRITRLLSTIFSQGLVLR